MRFLPSLQPVSVSVLPISCFKGLGSSRVQSKFSSDSKIKEKFLIIKECAVAQKVWEWRQEGKKRCSLSRISVFMGQLFLWSFFFFFKFHLLLHLRQRLKLTEYSVNISYIDSTISWILFKATFCLSCPSIAIGFLHNFFPLKFMVAYCFIDSKEWVG